MSKFLGIDTSNYTTSLSLFDDGGNGFLNLKKLLPVKSGEKGIRQSDAVFHHTVQLPELFDTADADFTEVKAVGVSVSPTLRSGSYMPCFLAGVSAAVAAAKTAGAKLYRFSHQQGHIAAVLAGGKWYDLIDKSFICFHLSGGTTDALLVSPDSENVFDIRLAAQSLDLKAGQAVDRVGLMLGFDFPCGVKLDEAAQKSDRRFNIKPSMKGFDCSLSGIENKCRKMKDDGESDEDVARFCILSISAAVEEMLVRLYSEHGEMPVVFCGGVSSNSLLRKNFEEKYGAVFAPAGFSTDNACGTAYLAYLKNIRENCND